MTHPTKEQRATVLRMLQDTLGAHGPIDRATATERATYWLLLVRPTADELAAVLETFPETIERRPINGSDFRPGEGS